MRPRERAFLWCILGALSAACEKPDVTVELYRDNGYTFSESDRDEIQRIADRTLIEVRRLLPALPPKLVLKVRSGKDVIPETGETAAAFQPNIVDWTVDTSQSGAPAATIQTQLRATLFHELHHLVRDAAAPRRTLMDSVVTEGMATAFERDFAGVAVPWGQYPENVREWVDELRALPPDAPAKDWLHRHPDGRRWIGLRAGTYLVDRAARESSRSSADLVTVPTDALLRLALPPPPSSTDRIPAAR